VVRELGSWCVVVFTRWSNSVLLIIKHLVESSWVTTCRHDVYGKTAFVTRRVGFLPTHIVRRLVNSPWNTLLW